MPVPPRTARVLPVAEGLRALELHANGTPAAQALGTVRLEREHHLARRIGGVAIVVALAALLLTSLLG